MTTVLQMRSVIQGDHQLHLHLTLPPDFPEQDGMSAAGIADLNTLFAYLDQLSPGNRTKEEIDRYVADERASWD